MSRLSLYKQALLDLVIQTSSVLPEDVQTALKNASHMAGEGTPEAAAFDTILRNVELARCRQLPICQDTGCLNFYIKAPFGFDISCVEAAARDAVAEATAQGKLRQNCVETVSGHNTGNNLAEDSPVFHWEFEKRSNLQVTLLLKGGGSENMGCQYSLPDKNLGAGRDLEGVRRCILDAVNRIQGMGCAPGILGVALGGDRSTGFEESKRQLLRKIGERNSLPVLAELERRVLGEANQLGIGPMGFGGKTTLLEVFIGQRSRLPACYFVTISYMCWCFRRQQILLEIQE